jgi:hypothetical protein
VVELQRWVDTARMQCLEDFCSIYIHSNADRCGNTTSLIDGSCVERMKASLLFHIASELSGVAM